MHLVCDEHERRSRALLFALERRDGNHRNDERAEDLGDLLAQSAFRESAYNDLLRVHDVEEVEGFRLPDDRDDGGTEELTDLVDRRRKLGHLLRVPELFVVLFFEHLEQRVFGRGKDLLAEFVVGHEAEDVDRRGWSKYSQTASMALMMTRADCLVESLKSRCR
jgi:hypothetical protein